MSFRSNRKQDKTVMQRDDDGTSKGERHAGAKRVRRNPLRAGWQRLRRAIDEREARAVLRDFSGGGPIGV